MRNMTHIVPTRSQNIGFVFDRRIHACQLVCEFDERGVTDQVGKISRPGQKEGGNRTEED